MLLLGQNRVQIFYPLDMSSRSIIEFLLLVSCIKKSVDKKSYVTPKIYDSPHLKQLCLFLSCKLYDTRVL